MTTRSIRAAVTLVELVLALAIAVVVIGGAVSLLVSVNRASHLGDIAGSLQDAALCLAAIEGDALCAVAASDGKPAARVSATELRLAIGRFRPDGRIEPSLVRYVPEADPAGGYRIRRTDAQGSALLTGTLEAYRFEALAGPGGPFLRVTLEVAPPKPAAGGPSTAVAVSGLFRLATAEPSGSQFDALDVLSDVQAVLGP